MIGERKMNWLSIFLAALSGFLVGGMWYGLLMGKHWMTALGLTEETMKNTAMLKIYGTTFLLSILSATALAHMFARLDGPSFRGVMMISVGIALGFIIPAIGTNYLFSRKKIGLFLIDSGYWILFYAAMGLVMAYFYAV